MKKIQVYDKDESLICPKNNKRIHPEECWDCNHHYVTEEGEQCEIYDDDANVDNFKEI